MGEPPLPLQPLLWEQVLVSTLQQAYQGSSHFYALNLELDTKPAFSFHYLSGILSFR